MSKSASTLPVGMAERDVPQLIWPGSYTSVRCGVCVVGRAGHRGVGMEERKTNHILAVLQKSLVRWSAAISQNLFTSCVSCPTLSILTGGKDVCLNVGGYIHYPCPDAN